MWSVDHAHFVSQFPFPTSFDLFNKKLDQSIHGFALFKPSRKVTSLHITCTRDVEPAHARVQTIPTSVLLLAGETTIDQSMAVIAAPMGGSKYAIIWMDVKT